MNSSKFPPLALVCIQIEQPRRASPKQ